jgi:hypothetical protein
MNNNKNAKKQQKLIFQFKINVEYITTSKL